MHCSTNIFTPDYRILQVWNNRGLIYGIILSSDKRGGSFLEALEVARKAVAAAGDKQATDIVLLDTRKTCGFADYFVICSGESERQLKAIYEEVQHALKKEGVLPHHREGTLDSGWVLLDFGDVVIHILAPLERQYYQLDELWEKATTVLRIQ